MNANANLASRYGVLQRALIVLLAINSVVYVLEGAAREAADSMAWFTLLALFYIETSAQPRARHALVAAGIRYLRIAAGAVVAAAFAGLGVAATIVGVLRAHLVFTERTHDGGLHAERRRIEPITLAIDLLMALAIAAEGLLVATVREVAGVRQFVRVLHGQAEAVDLMFRDGGLHRSLFCRQIGGRETRC